MVTRGEPHATAIPIGALALVLIMILPDSVLEIALAQDTEEGQGPVGSRRSRRSTPLTSICRLIPFVLHVASEVPVPRISGTLTRDAMPRDRS